MAWRKSARTGSIRPEEKRATGGTCKGAATSVAVVRARSAIFPCSTPWMEVCASRLRGRRLKSPLLYADSQKAASLWQSPSGGPVRASQQRAMAWRKSARTGSIRAEEKRATGGTGIGAATSVAVVRARSAIFPCSTPWMEVCASRLRGRRLKSPLLYADSQKAASLWQSPSGGPVRASQQRAGAGI